MNVKQTLWFEVMKTTFKVMFYRSGAAYQQLWLFTYKQQTIIGDFTAVIFLCVAKPLQLWDLTLRLSLFPSDNNRLIWALMWLQLFPPLPQLRVSLIKALCRMCGLRAHSHAACVAVHLCVTMTTTCWHIEGLLKAGWQLPVSGWHNFSPPNQSQEQEGCSRGTFRPVVHLSTSP